jgi:hypothetical protein
MKVGWVGLEPTTNALKGRLSVTANICFTVTYKSRFQLLLFCCSDHFGKSSRFLWNFRIALAGRVKAASSSTSVGPGLKIAKSPDHLTGGRRRTRAGSTIARRPGNASISSLFARNDSSTRTTNVATASSGSARTRSPAYRDGG